MGEIKKEKNLFGYYVFKIQTDDGVFEISFQNNLDLYWRYINKDCILNLPKEKEFYITKENYVLYSLFEELYNNIKEYKPFGSLNEELNAHYQYLKNTPERNLFKDNKVDWHSDDFVYENASRLLIEKIDDYFKVTFIKSKKQHDDGILMTYSIRISNSGSRYHPYNIAFMNMYNKLKEYDEDYRQVHVEEVIYKQKLLKKKVK